MPRVEQPSAERSSPAWRGRRKAVGWLVCNDAATCKDIWPGGVSGGKRSTATHKTMWRLKMRRPTASKQGGEQQSQEGQNQRVKAEGRKTRRVVKKLHRKSNSEWKRPQQRCSVVYMLAARQRQTSCRLNVQEATPANATCLCCSASRGKTCKSSSVERTELMPTMRVTARLDKSKWSQRCSKSPDEGMAKVGRHDCQGKGSRV